MLGNAPRSVQISSAECDQLLQRAPGWCERWESGEAPAVSLQQWQLDVCALAHWHGSAVIASAEPAVLLQMAEPDETARIQADGRAHPREWIC